MPVTQQGRQDYQLTTTCRIRPEVGKTSCDYLVPTMFHERTEVSVEASQTLVQPTPDNMVQEEVAEPEEVPQDAQEVPVMAPQPQQLGSFEVSVPSMSLPTLDSDNMHLMAMSDDASNQLLDVQEQLAHLAMMDEVQE